VDIYAGIFAPYGYDDLIGYLPQNVGSTPSNLVQTAPASAPPATAAPNQLAQMCGEDSRDIAGLPDRSVSASHPADRRAQRVALGDLADASAKAAQGHQGRLPDRHRADRSSRLAAMQQRIEAMIAAVGIVQPALEKLYGLLSDEQKARLSALGNNQRQSQTAKSAGHSPRAVVPHSLA